MRVAILSYRSDPNVGGQGVYVDYLSRALVEAGAQVDVISGPPYPGLDPRVGLVQLPSLDLYAQPSHGHYALRPHHLLSPTDTYEYFGHLSGKFVEPYTFGQRALHYLRSCRDRYDAVLDNQTLASGILKLQDRLDIPLVTMVHHPITQDRQLALDAAPDPLHRWLVRRWYAFHRMQIRVAKRLDWLTCPSLSSKADIVDAFGVDADRIHPIPLGVDQATFTPMAGVRRAGRRLISTASADTPLKGLPILLQAYALLRKADPELELVVIGKLREGAASRMLEALDLRDKVTFKSGLSRQELAMEFNRATIAVTPSLYEGFGLPAAEAMSCGTPVIVSDGGALPEVAGDAGIVVPRGDPGALAAAISELLSEPDRHAAVARACLDRARTAFNWSAIAPRYIDLFEQAIAARC
ncbi:MAG: hypothetical protein B7X53_09275 [Hyphomonas sp. 34-62-18]|nr:MAG: hypothetical protein B7X53_09275 [Hyphomonas sp. 34-62-18]